MVVSATFYDCDIVVVFQSMMAMMMYMVILWRKKTSVYHQAQVMKLALIITGRIVLVVIMHRFFF